MKDLNIEPTYKTPQIEMNPKGQFTIRGRSILENASEFYLPIEDWLKEYGQRPSSETFLDIYLEYLNSSSAKCFMELLKNLEKIRKKGNKVLVNWHYKEDDSDMLEIGQDFGQMLNLEFSYVIDP